MKKLKIILPMLAFIFAIALSFAFAGTNETTVQGYYEASPDNWQPVNVDCEGSSDCKIRFLPDPTIHQVYATPDASQPLDGSGEIIDL
ncbi:MAG: DUF6520 family protein [Flavobacteriaceae bacterium]